MVAQVRFEPRNIKDSLELEMPVASSFTVVDAARVATGVMMPFVSDDWFFKAWHNFASTFVEIPGAIIRRMTVAEISTIPENTTLYIGGKNSYVWYNIFIPTGSWALQRADLRIRGTNSKLVGQEITFLWIDSPVQ